ncbi:chaperonin-containing T-complex alpha subunit Cct1 [Blastocladiella emersonii ATCC 22665]|nr:chaperonin-containing T-complex alpha subunit Cct1 [Blastocladiella emersonii ATCC 22665]
MTVHSAVIMPRSLDNRIAFVAKLCAYHALSQQPGANEAKRALKAYGLDLIKGEIRDNMKAGVLEPAMSKIKSLKAATEAAISILRIDDMIKLTPAQQQGQDPHDELH